MSVTTTNLIQGPGTVYVGDFGADEPGNSEVSSTPAASAWTDVGGTLGGVKSTHARQFATLQVDQITFDVERRLTGESLMVETQMAEATLENFKTLMNGGTAASGTGFKTYEPVLTTSATQPTYKAVIIDGFAPSGKRRRVIVRKVLSIGDIAPADSKTDQKVFAVQWAAHYVSSTTLPFKVIDEVA